ncbi:MAG: hypothetical protein ABH828_02490 [archaeon]
MPRRRKIKPGEVFDPVLHVDRRKNQPKAVGVVETGGKKGTVYFYEKENIGGRKLPEKSNYIGLRADSSTGKRSYLYEDTRDPDIPYLYKKQPKPGKKKK